jgi:hypothetical protein
MMGVGKPRKHLERLVVDWAENELGKATAKMIRVEFNP